MDVQIWWNFWLCTALCLVGFLKWPKSVYELLRPRFVVPACIWLAVCGNFLNQEFVIGPTYDTYQVCREQFGATTLLYVSFCLALFWAGYLLPLGSYMARPLLAIQGVVPVNAKRLGRIGVLIILGGVLFFLLCSGLSALGIPGLDSGGIIPVNSSLAALEASVILGTTMIGAALIGISWPERNERTFLNTFFRLSLLFLACTPGMANMSRATGLPVICAAIAWSVRSRRLGWPFLAAVLWTAYCTHAAFGGRSEYGHYSGIGRFLTYLTTESIFAGRDLFSAAFGAADDYTSVSVAMRAAASSVDCHVMTPLNWILDEIPVPRGLANLPDYTTDVTYYLGGQGTWGYMTSFFGDTFLTFGWAGAWIFALWGVLYKMVDRIAFSAQQREVSVDGTFALQPYMLMAFMSYVALEMGLFSTNRAMIVMFFFPFYALTFLILARRLFVSAGSNSYMPETANHYA